MADSKDLPCHPMRWINDSDRNEFAPNGHVLPPQGSIDLPGLTKLEYAAIHLRVEHEDCPAWLNEMIREANRAELAKAAAQGLIASNDDGAGDRLSELPEYAHQIADAMIAEIRRG